jgi:hypothetical protein
MGVGQLVQLLEPVGHLLVLIQQDAELLVLEGQALILILGVHQTGSTPR